jgi:hypothetical protein
MSSLNWWNVGPPRAWSHHQLPNIVQNVLLHRNTTAEIPSPFRMTSWARWMVSKPPKAIVQVSEGRAHPSRVCQSASKATTSSSMCKSITHVMPQAWGFNIHPWASCPHEGPNWSFPHEYLSTRKSPAEATSMPSRGS